MAATLAVLAAVALAGCGSSYTKGDLIARADAICASTLRQTRTITPATGPSLAGLAAYLAQALRLERGEERQLRALKRPSGSAADNALYGRYLQALAGSIEIYDRLALAAGDGDQLGVTTAEAALRGNRASQLAARYGLRSCGRSGATVS